MAFKKRTTAPSSTNKYWIHTSNSGLNECIEINKKSGSCIPNCVGYAWGRFYEITGKKPKLCRANAELWYDYNDGYKRGKTPKLGAIICWSKGKVGVSSDGAGHVAVVEEIYKDGSILTSNSGYNSTRFYLKKIPKGYALSGYSFQGFIYPPEEIKDAPVEEEPIKVKYSKGKVYTLQANMKVRAGAGTSYAQKLVKDLSADGKKNATSKNDNDPALLKKGTKITVQDVKSVGSEVWLKCASGWICAMSSKGVYVI